MRPGPIVALLLLAAGCASAPAPPSMVPTGPGRDAPASTVRASWRGFDVEEVRVGAAVLRVAVAATPEERAAGLQGVSVLDGIDGMLFVFDEPSTARFWMRGTFIDLDVLFFDGKGGMIGRMTMPPCRSDPCPTYGPDRPYRWALEVPAGKAAGLSGLLVVGDR